MGKILLHSHLEVFSPIIALDQGEKDLYMFSPMYYFEQCSYVIWNDYAKCLWELEFGVDI